MVNTLTIRWGRFKYWWWIPGLPDGADLNGGPYFAESDMNGGDSWYPDGADSAGVPSSAAADNNGASYLDPQMWQA